MKGHHELHEDGETAPASSAQRRFWALSQMHPGSSAYHVPAALRIRGPLDHVAFEGAFQALVARHEILRTHLDDREGGLQQVITSALRWPIDHVDLRGKPAALDDRLQDLARRPFDLSRTPLGRLHLVQLAANQHVLLLNLHHSITDGVSMQLLTREWATLYAHYTLGQRATLAEDPVQYRSYSDDQGQWLTSEEAERQLAYWTKRLAGPAEAPLLRRPEVDGALRSGGRVHRELSGAHLHALLRFSRNQRVTLFMTLNAALHAVLYRYGGQRDVRVGIPLANRSRSEFAGVVGPLLNTVVVRADCHGALPFAELLLEIKQRCLEAYANQQMPFDRVTEALSHTARRPDAQPFHVALAMQDAPQPFTAGDLVCEPYSVFQGEAKFDLTLSALQTSNGGPANTVGGSPGLSLTLEHAHDRLDVGGARRLLDNYVGVLEQVCEHPERRLAALDLCAESCSRQQYRAPTYALPASLSAAFDRQVARRPYAIAVSDRSSSLSYRELHDRADALARGLIAHGVRLGARVGLCLHRSTELVVGIVGVLKAGAAYVPIEPRLPAARQRLIAQDAGLALVLADAQVDALGGPAQLPIDEVVAAGRGLEPPPGGLFGLRLHPDNLAYVIYTSGSTGRPKGVPITHRQVLRLFEACERDFELRESDVWSLFHSHAFDFSVWELWGALLHGGRAVVVPHWVSRDREAFHALLVDEGVTVLSQTPSAFYALSDYWCENQGGAASATPASLREIVLGGEAFDAARCAAWLRAAQPGQPRLSNLYGITETTVHATFSVVTRADVATSIGLPLEDVHIQLLDRDGGPAPRGMPGELCIGGPAVGRGYLGRPGLTAERFVPDPDGPPGSRAYRSGDLGWRDDRGQLHYLGRIDDQVQLRGFRIEPREIACVLRGHPGVRDAAVLLLSRGSEGGVPEEGGYLAAFLVAAPQPLDLDELTRAAANQLPEHMVPSRFIRVDALPLTENGKLDRTTLAGLATVGRQVEPSAPRYVAARTEVEARLEELWLDLLPADRIGIHDNFFELGGDSIVAMQMVGRARQSGLVLSPRELFERPTIAALAEGKQLGATDAGPDKGQRAASPIPAKLTAAVQARYPRVEACYPMTPIQQGIWFESHLAAEEPVYREQLCLTLEGPCHVDAWRSAYGEVLAHHPALRSVFLWHGEGHGVQVVLPATELAAALQVIERSKDQRSLRAAQQRDRQRPLDLERGPLFSLTLVRGEGRRFHLIWTHHHLLLDGWSLSRVFEDLAAAYRAARAGRRPRLRPSTAYPAYIAWLSAWQPRHAADSQRFFQAQLQDAPSATRLVDHGMCAAPSSSARHAACQQSSQVQLSVAETDTLVSLLKQHHLTANTLLCGAWAVLLARHSGQRDLVFGTTLAGRPGEVAGIEDAVGLFINTLPVRARVDPGRPLLAWLSELQLQLAELQQWSGTPLPEVARFAARAPESLFECLWAFENYYVADDLGDLGSELAVTARQVSDQTHYPLTLIASSNERITLRANWRQDRYRPEFIEGLLNAFVVLLRDVGRGGLEDRLVSSFATLAEVDRTPLLMASNQTARDHCAGAAPITRLRRHAEERPNSPAVVDGHHTLTYAQLSRNAAHLAGRIRATVGADLRKPDPVVAVLLPRSAAWVTAIVAAHEAGCAYLPIDADAPEWRVAAILRDAQPVCIIGLKQQADPLAGDQGGCGDTGQRSRQAAPSRIPWIWLEDPQAGDKDLATPAGVPHPEGLAYVVYTSGSAGRPKGVEVSHRSLSNLCGWHCEAYGITRTDRGSLVAGLGFDAAVWEVWPYLAAGASVLVVPDNARRDPRRLRESLLEGRATVSFVPTPVAQRMLHEPWPEPGALRCLLTGGDRLHPLAGPPPLRLFNHYGPTEATVVATVTEVGAPTPSAPTRFPSIGGPISNTRVYVLDDALQPVPRGLPGELFVGGVGVARGYRGAAGLTASRFVPDPFSARGQRLYRTGDRVRFDEAGELEFLGRIDRQVKLQGVRIEPAEVESVLAGHEHVREVAVVLNDDCARPHLIAFCASDALNERDLRHFARERLPPAMMPSRFVSLGALPLTSRGKLDVPALQALATDDSEPVVAPRTGNEAILHAIWQGLLPSVEFGVADNFFTLGGDSILCVQMVNRARLRGLTLEARDVFAEPTIEALAHIARPRGAPVGTAPPATADSSERAAIDRRLGELGVAGEHSDTGAAIEDTYGLSPLQEGLLFHDINAAETSGARTYVEQFSLSIHGSLDAGHVETAWRILIKRHAVLRSVFLWDGLDRPTQAVLDARVAGHFHVTRHSLLTLPVGERQQALARLLRDQRQLPFDLERPPLVRLLLVDLEPERLVVVVTHHHIILDGWSVAQLLEEWLAIHRALVQRSEPPLAPAGAYRDFIGWLRSRDEGAARDYFARDLAGATPCCVADVSLSAHATTPSARTHASPPECAEHWTAVPAGLDAQLRAFAERHGLTLNTLFQGAWSLALARLCQTRDVIFGSVLSGRAPGLYDGAHALGLFINTVPVRQRISSNTSRLTWLTRLQKHNAELLEHGFLPLSSLFVGRGQTQPLFDTLYVFESYPVHATALEQCDGFAIDSVEAHHWTHYPLSVTVLPGPPARLRLAYRCDVLNAQQVTWLGKHVLTALASMLHDVKAPVTGPRLRITSMSGRATTTRASPQAQTAVHRPFEALAAHAPEATALRTTTGTWSYRALNDRAERYAAALVREGVRLETRVAACMSRGPEQVALLLGILKAGAAFVIIDRELPDARVRAIVQQTSPRLVVTEGSLHERLTAVAAPSRVVAVELWSLPTTAPVLPSTHPDVSAYVLFTSGSSGAPKGSIVTHRSWHNQIRWLTQARNLCPDDRVLYKSSLAFDGALWEVFGALSAGASVVIAGDGCERDAEALFQLLVAERVSVAQFVPSLLDALLRAWQARPDTRGITLRYLACGGEPLPRPLAERIFETLPAVRLQNVYGPTEATVDATSHEIDVACVSTSPFCSLPIGHAIDGVTARVLDPDLLALPRGIVGELVIGGVGVARGYVGQPGLTAERFVPDPLGPAGSRAYRTGDRVAEDAEGRLVFLGRADDQVKLRGLRIELGEIEAALADCEGVRASAAYLAPRASRDAQPRLVACVVPHPGSSPTGDALRGTLQARLPGYMVPASITFVEKLPRTPSGKLDRRRLLAPPPTAGEPASDAEPPKGFAEERLATIWRSLLRRDRIGRDDNFFELGGDSIVSIQLVSRARRAGIALRPRDVFDAPTLRALAATAGDVDLPPDDMPAQGPVPLTPIQWWLAEQRLANIHHYNQAVFLELRDPLDPEHLQQALQDLMRHHDALRLRYDVETGEQHHDELAGVAWPLRVVDTTTWGRGRELAMRAENERAQAGLNLTRGPVARAVYYRGAPDARDRLLLVLHHWVVDAVSWRILLEDLQQRTQDLAAGRPHALPDKTSSYQRWARALAAYARSAPAQRERSHWTQQPWHEAGHLPPPGERQRVASAVRRALNEKATDQLLRGVPGVYGARLHDALLAGLARALGASIGTRYVALALEGHGRKDLFPDVDPTRTVGWFTVIYPVLLPACVAPDQAVAATREALARVPAGGLGFGALRCASGAAPELAAVPEPEVSFNYLGQLDAGMGDGTTFRLLPDAGPTSDPRNDRAHALDVSAFVRDGVLQLNLDPSPGRVAASVLERVANDWVTALDDIARRCAQRRAPVYAPSDFPDADLDQGQLDRILEKLSGSAR